MKGSVVVDVEIEANRKKKKKKKRRNTRRDLNAIHGVSILPIFHSIARIIILKIMIFFFTKRPLCCWSQVEWPNCDQSSSKLAVSSASDHSLWAAFDSSPPFSVIRFLNQLALKPYDFTQSPLTECHHPNLHANLKLSTIYIIFDFIFIINNL